MKEQLNNTEMPKTTPEPAESFEIDFLNGKGIEAQNAMSQMGSFSFRRNGVEKDGLVFFEGERRDGTKIKITIEKGNDYKSPAEIAEEKKKVEEEK